MATFKSFPLFLCRHFLFRVMQSKTVTVMLQLVQLLHFNLAFCHLGSSLAQFLTLYLFFVDQFVLWQTGKVKNIVCNTPVWISYFGFSGSVGQLCQNRSLVVSKRTKNCSHFPMCSCYYDSSGLFRLFLSVSATPSNGIIILLLSSVDFE